MGNFLNNKKSTSLSRFVLVVINTTYRTPNPTDWHTALGKYRRVTHVEELYVIIRKVNKKDLLHSDIWKGMKIHVVHRITTCAQLQGLYHGISRSVCFCAQVVSFRNVLKVSTAPLKLMTKNGFFCKLQVCKIIYHTCIWVFRCLGWSLSEYSNAAPLAILFMNSLTL